MRSFQNKLEKPLVVLVYEQSFLRIWMEKALNRRFRVCIFSTTEDSIAYIRSIQSLDVLITDLDFNLSALGGCNIAREVHRIFPECPIFIFRDSAQNNDHRIMILQRMNQVKFLSKPFGALFLVSHIKNTLDKLKD